MSKNKESEITIASHTKKQKKAEKTKSHIADISNQIVTPLELSVKGDSKLCINSPTPEEASKKKVIEINKATANLPENEDNQAKAQDDFELPENKKSLGHKPFKIVTPDKDPIIEQPIVEKESAPEEAKKEEEKTANEPELNPITPAHEPSPVIKTLSIEIVESSTVEVGTVLTVTPQGLAGSKRGARDGRAYFGTDADQELLTNDYVFSSQEQGFGKRHFMIEFDEEKKGYYLKALEDGTGTFIKIVQKEVINSNVILSFNALHLAVIFPCEQSKSDVDAASVPSLKDIPREVSTNDAKTYCSRSNIL